MNALEFSSSPSVATLNVRNELSSLRILARRLRRESAPNGRQPPDADVMCAELDRLEAVLVDMLTRDEDGSNGWYSAAHIDEYYVPVDEHNKLDNKCDELDEKLDEAKEKIAELEETLANTPDETRDLLSETRVEVRRLKAELDKSNARFEALKTPIELRVRTALYDVHPGRKSKAKLEQHERTVAAIQKALKGE